VLSKLMELYQHWAADRIGIEEVNFSAVYAPFMSYIVRADYGLTPTFVPLETRGRRKETRIHDNLKPAFESAMWYINRDDCAELVQELLEYPNSLTCDLVDALAYTDEAVQRPSTPDERERAWRLARREQQSYGITGYGDFV
jgi:hypothetical protein